MYIKGNYTFTVLKIVGFMYTILVHLFCGVNTMSIKFAPYNEESSPFDGG